MVSFIIFGEPASKANSRKVATVGAPGNQRTLFIKSEKALSYEQNALKQIPPAARLRLEGPVRVTLKIWYASERPDLDESLVLDILQDRFEYQRSAERHVLKDGMHTVTPAKRERVLVQHGVYRNDRQVREKHVFWDIDPNNPRTVVLVEPLHAQQEALL